MFSGLGSVTRAQVIQVIRNEEAVAECLTISPMSVTFPLSDDHHAMLVKLYKDSDASLADVDAATLKFVKSGSVDPSTSLSYYLFLFLSCLSFVSLLFYRFVLQWRCASFTISTLTNCRRNRCRSAREGDQGKGNRSGDASDVCNALEEYGFPQKMKSHFKFE